MVIFSKPRKTWKKPEKPRFSHFLKKMKKIEIVSICPLNTFPKVIKKRVFGPVLSHFWFPLIRKYASNKWGTKKWSKKNSKKTRFLPIFGNFFRHPGNKRFYRPLFLNASIEVLAKFWVKNALIRESASNRTRKNVQNLFTFCSLFVQKSYACYDCWKRAFS